MHRLERNLILNAEPDAVWAFLATPLNLNAMTPPELHFRILSEVPPKMYNGLLILYEIGLPLFGTHRWLTEIKHIREGAFFVDEQRLGPYRFWYHQHEVEPYLQNKTRMLDRVSYQLPYGGIGSLVHKLWVKKMLNEIFDYRARRLQDLFNGASSHTKKERN